MNRDRSTASTTIEMVRAISGYVKAALRLLDLLRRRFGGGRARCGAPESSWTGLEEIEGRILFSASPLAGGVPETTPEQTALLDEAMGTAFEAQVADTEARESVRNEIVFIDGGLPDIDRLLEGVAGRSGAGSHVEVVVLDPMRDGTEQLTQALAAHRDIDAVHIVTHGAPGAIRLGGSWLGLEDLSHIEDSVRRWGESLRSGADVLFYGCDLAATEEGREFVETIGAWTGADVAASEDATGASTLGGDWVLEHRTGRVDAATAFSSDSQEAWGGLLDTADEIWLSTGSDVPPPSGTPGLSSWSAGQVVQVSDPGFALEPGTTNGTFSLVANFDLMALDLDANVDALHLVSRTMTIGGANAITLQPGDLLLSFSDNETLTSLSIVSALDEDVVLFRPLLAGNYTLGTFIPVLTNLNGLFGVTDITGLTLVEEDTQMGDLTLQSGHFLFSREGGNEANDVYLFQTTDVGAGTTSGTASVLVEGDDIDVNGGIQALELIDDGTVIAGRTLLEGTLLISVDSSDPVVGDNGISVTRNDIFGVELTQTTLGSGTAAGNATLVFEGADVGLDTSNEEIDALGLQTILTSPPVLTTNAGLTVNEGGSGSITNAQLLVNDADTAAAQITYTVTTAPANGTLRLNGTPLSTSDTFTQDDINSGLLTYLHDGSETASDSFTFTVSDGSGGSIGATAFSITVNPQNDAPVLATNTGLTVNEGASGTIAGAQLLVTDVDTPAAQITFTMTAAPSNGTLRLNAIPISTNGTFTQDDINSGLLTYLHDGSETASDSFTFTVSDGSGGSIGATAFSITVNPQNDAPVLATNTGLTVNEGASGTIAGAQLLVTDVDTPAAQITFTMTAAPSNGTLRLNAIPISTNGTFTQDDINSGLLTYLHDGSETASDSFTFTVSDGSGGSIGATAFSITVNPQNDAPVLAVNRALSLESGDAAALDGTHLQVTDDGSNSAQLIYTLTTPPASGVLSLNGVPLTAGGNFSQADIDAGSVAYAHDGIGTAPDGFSFVVTDGQGATSPLASFSIEVLEDRSSPGPSGDPPPIVDLPPVPPPGDPLKDPRSDDPTTETPDSPETPVDPSPRGPSPVDDGPMPLSGPTPSASLSRASLDLGFGGAAEEGASPPGEARIVSVSYAPPAASTTQTPISAQEQLLFLAEETGFWNELNSVKKDIQSEILLEELVVGGVSIAGLTLSAGYVLWTVRASYLLSILLSSLPAWRTLDPLPVLDHFAKDPIEPGGADTETLASLIEKGRDGPSNSQLEQDGYDRMKHGDSPSSASSESTGQTEEGLRS